MVLHLAGVCERMRRVDNEFSNRFFSLFLAFPLSLSLNVSSVRNSVTSCVSVCGGRRVVAEMNDIEPLIYYG